MGILDKDLVRAVNTGRAFMLVGSGPSAAAGLPSWHSLAEMALEAVARSGSSTEAAAAAMSQKDYPRVFSHCADVLGIEALCSSLSPALQSSHIGPVYPLLAKWPIQCYITTNFDDLLIQALHAAGEAYVLRGNTREQMVQLRADTSSAVFRIHGDLSTPQDVVLTSGQYHDFEQGVDREYWRAVVASVLRNVDLVIVGYSVSDPNFQEQLAWAREFGAPNHPVFMFTPGLTETEIADLYTQYNIRVIEYENPLGDHAELLRVLRRYEPFIASRHGGLLGAPPVDEDQARTAGALYVFTQARVSDHNGTCLEHSYCALMLTLLADLDAGEPIALSGLLLAIENRVGGSIDPPVAQRSVEHLYETGYVSWDADSSLIQLLPSGRERVVASRAERATIDEQFQVSCRIFLNTLPEPLDEVTGQAVIDAMKIGIVEAFDRRGLEIAKAAMSDAEVDISDATDILSIVNTRGEALPTLAARAAFADLCIRVLLEPTSEMKAYLACVSQGYFAYHVLSWDSAVTDARLSQARAHTWILDSSILLFLLAKDCQNHQYAVELLQRMQELGLTSLTTDRLFTEVEKHARWALRDFVGAGVDSFKILENVSVSPGHRQNVFAQGFARWSIGRGAPTFSQYMEECVGTSSPGELHACLLEATEQLEIEVRDFEAWPSIRAEAAIFAERDELAAEIRATRRQRNTYRSDEQCTAEAEVIVLARHESATFLSPSNVLAGMARAPHKVNWRPEAMYRFLALFSTMPDTPETLYESMTATFFYAGFDIVDKATVAAYGAGLSHQARMQMDEATREYAAALDASTISGISDDFESVPDEEKPFYAMQFAHYVAVRAAREVERARLAADAARRGSKLTEKQRAELSRYQADEAARQQRAKKRKRRDQSQSGRKKKRKRNK